MGHEIVYCTRCASRIVGADFEKGKAFRLAGSAICSACVPTLTPQEQQSLTSSNLPELKSSTSKMKPVKATGGTSVRMPQVGPGTPPEGSNKALLIGGGVAFAAAALIAAVAGVFKAGTARPGGGKAAGEG